MSKANLIDDVLRAGGHLVIDLVTGRRHIEFRREDYDDEDWALLVDEIMPDRAKRRLGLDITTPPSGTSG